MKFHDRQSSERCIRKIISHHCLDKTRTRWNDFLFLITDDRDFRPQTCTNGLVFRKFKHIKNIFKDVYFTKNSFHITLTLSINNHFSEMSYMKNNLMLQNRWKCFFMHECEENHAFMSIIHTISFLFLHMLPHVKYLTL